MSRIYQISNWFDSCDKKRGLHRKWETIMRVTFLTFLSCFHIIQHIKTVKVYRKKQFWGLLPLPKNSPNIVSINKRVQENFVKDIMLNETFHSLIPSRDNILLILWAELRATSKVWEYTEGYILISTYWFIEYLIKVCMYKIF